MLDDSVFVATMTKSGGSVTITSGGNAPYTQNVEAGVQVFQIPMGVGSQSFSIQSNSGGSGSGTSSVPISASCWVSYKVHCECLS
jgi:glucan endo-1,3-alpha-glucosidase